MAGSSYGNQFRVTTWGESHGKGIGVVVDGCPAGLTLSEEDIQIYLNRRKPGQSQYTTARAEGDCVEILSGVFEGKTTGTPISLVVYNQDQKSRDYSNICDVYRPGHGDYTFDEKYGIRDYRGGGRSSGRETIGRVAAGAIAAKILKELGIRLQAYTVAVGPIEMEQKDLSQVDKNPLWMPDEKAAKAAEEFLQQCMKEHDSAGGIIECEIEGMPVGIGETVFDKLDAELAKAMLSIGAVKGFEIGEGFLAAKAKGSQNNDSFSMNGTHVVKDTNHSGGVLGGMSDGATIQFRVAVKPTPSISQSQKTITKEKVEQMIEIHGRHDPIIVPRAVVVVETMAAIVVLDGILRNMGARLDGLKKYYEVEE